MSFPWRSRSQLAWLTLLALACSSGEPAEVPVGTNLAANLRLGDSMAMQTLPAGWLRNEHHLTASVRTSMAIFVQSLDAGVTVDAELDGTGNVLEAYSYPGQPLSLLQARTSSFSLPAGKTLKVLVSRSGEPDLASAIHYRLFAYPINRAPEHGSATAIIGQVRAGEDLETSADIDEYTFSGQVGDDMVAYLANDGPGPGRFGLYVFDRNGGIRLGEVFAPSVGKPLEDNGSLMFTAPSGSFVVRVVGQDGLRSGYTFLVRQGSRAPEIAPATIGTNTVVSESFDYNGDVDEFTIHGTPGALVNLMLENNSTEPMAPSLETFGDGVWPRSITVNESRPLDAMTGAMPIPPGGDIRFRVANGFWSADTITGRGAYLVRVVPINPGPETASPSLTGTDSIIGEQIDEYDDRDEFTLAWPAGGVANIVLRRPDLQVWEPLRLHLTSLAGDSIQSVALYGSNSVVESGEFELPAGNYRVRVVTSDGSILGAFRGPYSAYIYLLSTARAP